MPNSLRIDVLVAIFFITKRSPHASRVGELLPGETIAFIHVPDVARTRERILEGAPDVAEGGFRVRVVLPGGDG